MNKYYYILFFILLNCFGAKAQNQSQYSTYMFNHFVLNPAYCGSKQTLYANVVQRYQWVGIEGSPKIQLANIQYPLKSRKVGLGLTLGNESLGPRNNIQAFGCYAYHLKMGAGKLSMGLKAGMYSYQLETSKIEFKDQTDIVNQAGTIKRVVPSADFGLYYYTRNFYTSIAFNQLWGAQIGSIRADANYSKVSPTIFYSAGYALTLKKVKLFGEDKLVINPSLLVKTTSGAPISYDINCNVRLIDIVWGGLSYRVQHSPPTVSASNSTNTRSGISFNQNSLVILAQVNLSSKYRLGYAFDLGLNPASTNSYGTHEVYLGYDLNVHRRNINTPRF